MKVRLRLEFQVFSFYSGANVSLLSEVMLSSSYFQPAISKLVVPKGFPNVFHHLSTQFVVAKTSCHDCIFEGVFQNKTIHVLLQKSFKISPVVRWFFSTEFEIWANLGWSEILKFINFLSFL